jgi:putative Mg2+ transporter-C (MgtC) family protein
LDWLPGGMYLAAGAATVFALIILWALQFLERKITQKFKQKILSIEAKSNADTKKILDQVEEEKVGFVTFSVDKTEPGLFIQLKLDNVESEKINKLIQDLQQNADINKIFWE